MSVEMIHDKEEGTLNVPIKREYKYEKKLFNLMDLILRAERCTHCGEWMSVYYTTDLNNHDTLQRKCYCNKK